MSGQNQLPNFRVEESAGRLRVGSGAPWESRVGYSRAIRAGRHIFVTGTVGRMPDGSYPETAAEQTRQSLRIIQAAVELLGATLKDVVRTRIFVTDISQWQAIGGIHAEHFADTRPATTMVQVARLIDDGALVEIEADAIISS